MKPAAEPADATLRAYLVAACADEPELLATVLALAEAGEVELLHVVRDFRDNLSDRELARRHGEALDERLRLIHRVYVEEARRVREQVDRPLRARKCYEARMVARRDNYQAMLDDGVVSEADRPAVAALIGCARDKVSYDALPARLGREASAIEDEVLRLRQRFKDWAAARKSGEERSAPGGLSDG